MANYGRTICRAGIGIVTIGIIARYLNPSTFGQYALIVALVAVFKNMPGMGVSMILTREVAKDKEKAGTMLAAALILQSVLSMITLTILGLIFYLIAPSIEVFYAALICGVAMILEAYKMLFSAIYQGFEKMEFDTLQTLITQSLYLVFLIVATGKGAGLSGIFWALLLAQCTGAILGYVMVVKVFAWPKFRRVGSQYKFLFKEAYPIGIMRILRKLNFRVGTLLLAAIKSNVEVGIFHGSHKIIESLNFVTDASSQAMFPIFCRLSTSSQASLDQAYQKSVKFSLLIGLPVAIFLSSFSEPAVVLVLGHKYVESSHVLQILAWVLALMFLTNVMGKILIAGNKAYLTTVIMGVALGVNTLLNLLLIPRLSYVGASIAVLISRVVVLGLCSYFIFRHLGLHISLPTIVKPLFAGFATYGLLFMFHDANMFVGGAIEIILYAVILISIRTFTKEEICYFKELLQGISPVKPIKA
jgi:O-antigen/teichoic acid export membrane protein